MAFCANCGTAYTEGAVVCSNCGYPTGAQQQVRHVQYVKPKVPGRGFGITSMVMGIVGLLSGFYLTFLWIGLSIIALVAGIIHEMLIIFIPLVLMFSSLSIMAVVFSIVAKKRGYINGISKSGTVMGVIGVTMYLLFILVVIGASL